MTTKKSLLVISTVFCSMVCSAQSKESQKIHEIERVNIEIASQDFSECKEDTPYPSLEQREQIYNVADQMPSFPGGEMSLFKFVSLHIKNPSVVEEQGIHGQVILRFVVNEDGTIGEITIQKGIEKHCDEEAVRLVKSFPKFIPGKQQGKAVKVWYTLPIRFAPRVTNNEGKSNVPQ